jgi:hypothetical protein
MANKEATARIKINKLLERHIGQHYFGSGRPYIEGALGKTK